MSFLTLASRGQIRRGLINQFADALTGVKLDAYRLEHDSATVPPLTLRNHNAGATAPHLIVQNHLNSGALLTVTDAFVTLGAALKFGDGSVMSSAGLGSNASSVISPTDAIVQADSDANASGEILFKIGTGVAAKITQAACLIAGQYLGTVTGCTLASLNDVILTSPQAYCSTDNYTGGGSVKIPLLSLDAGNVTKVGPQTAPSTSSRAAGGALALYAGGAERWRISAVGNLMYGTSTAIGVYTMVTAGGSPASHAFQSGSALWYLTLQDTYVDGASLRLETTQNNPFQIITGSTKRLAINISGQVGIGNIAPGSANLDHLLTLEAPSGQVALRINGSGTVATTANTGANGAPPAQVAAYLLVNLGGTDYKIPYYNT